MASSPALENDRRRRLSQARHQSGRMMSGGGELAFPPLQIPNAQEGAGESEEEEEEEDEELDEDPYQQERELTRRQGESRRRQQAMQSQSSQGEIAGQEEGGEEEGEDSKSSAESKAKELLQKELKEWILRYANGAFGLSLVGLLVPFLIWNAQLIMVNICKFEVLPPLKLWEILSCIILDGLLFAAAVILYLFFVILCLALFAPHLLLLHFGQEIYRLFKF